MSAHLTDADCGAIVRASIDPQRVLAGIDGHEGSTPDVLLTTVDAILTARLAAVEAEADMWERQAQNFAVSATRETARADRAEKAEAERDRLAAAVERVEALADEFDGRADWLVYQLALPASEHVRRCADQLRAALSDAGRGK